MFVKPLKYDFLDILFSKISLTTCSDGALNSAVGSLTVNQMD